MKNAFSKKMSATILLLFVAHFTFAQQKDTETNKGDTVDNVYTFVEQMPTFNGDVKEYIKANLKYPPIAMENGIEGKSIVEFVIGEDGLIDKTSIKILKNIGWGMDQEAVRIVSNMPVWEPGKLNDKNVKVRMVLPIVFKLP